ISLLEDTNHQLTTDLAAARREADAQFEEQDRLGEQLQIARAEAERLRGDLANLPEAVPADGWQAVPGGAMIAIEGSVLFASGKVVIRESGRAALDSIAGVILSQYANKDVFIFGHTDDVPIKKSGWKDNYELSAQRALTVVRHIRDRGVDAARLVACGAGEHRPRVPNTSDEARAQNRRVEIFALDPVQ
ncbi:MAG: OmpA family protein, partial [Proteobacteria bacterium]|nr:OmpA family protein [Pseudomonadota bacterium]